MRPVIFQMVCLFAAAAGAAEFDRKAEAIDVFAGDDAILEVQLPDSSVGAYDVRLARVDATSGQVIKGVDARHGCDDSWDTDLQSRGVQRGERVTMFLNEGVPLGAYGVVARSVGSNGPWSLVSDPKWIVTEPVSRVVPCEQTSLSLQQQPVLAEWRRQANLATVRLVTSDGRKGQGVVINPWGHVLTADALVHGAKRVEVVFAPGAWAHGADEVRLTYVSSDDLLPRSDLQEAGGPFPAALPRGDRLAILIPAPGKSQPAFFSSFASLADRDRRGGGTMRFQHRGALFGVRRHDGATLRLEVEAGPGVVIPASHDARGTSGVLMLNGPLTKADQGSPVFDHAGVVWGILLDDGRATWATYAMDQYERWMKRGTLRQWIVKRDGGAE